MTSWVASGPPAGNYVQTGDDDCTGACSHSGGYWNMAGYNFTLNANASLTQTGGDMDVLTGGTANYIQEEGSSMIVSTADNTYDFRLKTWANYVMYIRGESGNRCFLGGTSAANRTSVVDISSSRGSVKYCDFEYIFDDIKIYYMNGRIVFWNCYFNNTDTNNKFTCGGFANVTFDTCEFDSPSGSVAYIINFQSTEIHIINPTITTSYTSAGPLYKVAGVSYIYGSDIWADWGEITWSNPNEEFCIVYFAKITLDSTPADCSISVSHNNPPTRLAETHALDPHEISAFNGGCLEGDHFYVVTKIFAENLTHGATTTYYSVFGESGTNNDSFKITTAKDGYRTDEQDVWLDGDYEHNVTLQAQTELDDILSVCNEILDINENKLVINEATSELWLYNDAGDTVIKKWPISDKDGGSVRMQGTGPCNRDKRTL